MTYYLKYRSQTLDQLDLEKVRDQLQKIVSSGRVPHALLFSGPRGSGKTSAATNRGVDDIRTLRETVKLSPISARMKVYIIDEAHMLTTEASNALLKTLEEPPAHAMFILATTAPEKLLDTIRSRSTLINFYKGTVPEVIRSLKRVVKGEKL